MARSKNNIVTEGLSGRINQLVFRQRFGKTTVSKKPLVSGNVSPHQLQIRLTFKEATIYAKAVLTDEAIKEAYKAKARPGQSAYNLAVADFFNLPVIGDIDTSGYINQSGSNIRVPVTDDFKVMGVTVSIQTSDGTPIESGNATISSDGLHWVYNSTQLNSVAAGNIISITATDMPGHAITKQKTV